MNSHATVAQYFDLLFEVLYSFLLDQLSNKCHLGAEDQEQGRQARLNIMDMLHSTDVDRVGLTSLGLPLGLEAPDMTPDGVIFLFFLSTAKTC